MMLWSLSLRVWDAYMGILTKDPFIPSLMSGRGGNVDVVDYETAINEATIGGHVRKTDDVYESAA